MADSTKLSRYKIVEPDDKSNVGRYYVKTKNGAYVQIKDIRIFEGDKSLSSTPSLRRIGKKGQKFTIYKDSVAPAVYNNIVAKEGAPSGGVPGAVAESVTFTLADDNIYEPYETSTFVVQKFVKPSSSKDSAVLEYSAYEPVNVSEGAPRPTGEILYVRVRFKGDTADTVVPLSSLKLAEEPDRELGLDDVAGLAGKTLIVDGDYRETEPLSEEQSKVLVSKKFIYSSTLASDICRNDEASHTSANLRVKGGDANGQYVRESDVVQPKCYNYAAADAKDFDAFLVTDKDGKSYVVSKRYAPSKNPSVVLFGKQQIEFKTGDDGNVRKLVKSTGGIINCDVIQTSSTSSENLSKAESCEVVNVNEEKIDLLNGADDEDYTKKNLAARIKTIYEQFLVDYKAKNYELDNQILLMQRDVSDPEKVKGEFVNYVLNHRYMISDIMPVQDFGVQEISEILNMPDNGFKFDHERLNGGAKYDRKKGIKNSFNKWGNGLAYSLGFIFSSGGALVSLISPLLLVGVAVGVAGWAVGIPVYHSLKKGKVETKKPSGYIYPNKVEKQNEKVKVGIFEQIEEILAQVKLDDNEIQKLPPSKQAAAIQEKKQQFLAEMAMAEHKLDLLSASKTGGEFSIADGKVDQSNTTEFSRYLAERRECADQIEKLQKEIKSAIKHKKNNTADYQLKVDRLAALNAKFNDLQTKYHSSGSESELDPEQEEIRTRIEEAKGFILAKYYGEEIKIEDASSAEEKKKLEKECKEFVRTTEIKVDKKHKKFKYKHEVKKSERSIRKRRAWKKRSKNSKGFFSRIAAIARGVAAVVSERETVNAYDELCKVSYTNGHEHVEDLKEELKKEHHEEKEHEKEHKKAKAKEKDETKVREKRSITGLSVADAEKCIIEVCKAMEELSGVMDKYFGDNELTGAANESEDYMKKLAHIYDYNENVLKAVYKDRRTTLFKQLNMKYSSRITTAAKRYKDYMTYFENKIVPSL